MDTTRQFVDRQSWWEIHCGAAAMLVVLAVFAQVVGDPALVIPIGLDFALLGYAALRCNRALLFVRRTPPSDSLDSWGDGVQLYPLERWGLWAAIAVGLCSSAYCTFELAQRLLA